MGKTTEYMTGSYMECCLCRHCEKCVVIYKKGIWDGTCNEDGEYGGSQYADLTLSIPLIHLELYLMSDVGVHSLKNLMMFIFQ